MILTDCNTHGLDMDRSGSGKIPDEIHSEKIPPWKPFIAQELSLFLI
jgi:hypothetical protein